MATTVTVDEMQALMDALWDAQDAAAAVVPADAALYCIDEGPCPWMPARFYVARFDATTCVRVEGPYDEATALGVAIRRNRQLAGQEG